MLAEGDVSNAADALSNLSQIDVNQKARISDYSALILLCVEESENVIVVQPALMCTQRWWAFVKRYYQRVGIIIPRLESPLKV